MAKGVMHVQWYATVFRSDMFVEAVAEIAAPVALEYGATRFTVQRSQDDHYRITQQTWFESKDDWYRYWEGPEMREFRARYSGKYQVPLTYIWFDEYAAGGAEPVSVTPADLNPETQPAPSGTA
ncbi:MAG: hypothetical protein FWD04_07040 [Conexibacteraceae bacterium]|nr:hypothetical protein [Conexibacteraceae bacterium]